MSDKMTKAPFSPVSATFGFPPEAFETSRLPDIEHEFIQPEELAAFERALQAPDPLQSPAADDAQSQTLSKRNSSVSITKRNSGAEKGLDDDLAATAADGHEADAAEPKRGTGTFITAQSDWAPVNPQTYRSAKRGRKRGRRRGKGTVEGLLGTRTKDETREGNLYQLSKWPLLLFVVAWLAGLGLAYLSTRWNIWVFEHFFTWRGERENLRRKLRRTSNYRDWTAAAKELDAYLGRQSWREENDFAYYDSGTVRRVWVQMRRMRLKAESLEEKGGASDEGARLAEELKALAEACVKNNFVGVENARLYSQTYYGTKNLVQNFVDEGERRSPCPRVPREL